MSLAKIDQNDETVLTFDVEVSGTKEDVSQYRFVIESEDYSIICKGTPTKDGIQVRLPKLKGILDEGVYKSALEIIIGERIFTPLTEVVEIQPNIELKVESKNAAPVEPKDKITVKVAGTKVSGVIAEAKEQGYIVVDAAGRKALKNKDGYIGVIEGDEMRFVDTAHDFVTDLFEEVDGRKDD